MVRTKKWHMGCIVPGIQLRKWMELISKGEAVVEERKSKGDYSTVYYCAMFYLLNAQNKLGIGERVTDVLSIMSFV